MLLAERLDLRASVVYRVVTVARTDRGGGGDAQVASANDDLRVARPAVVLRAQPVDGRGSGSACHRSPTIRVGPWGLLGAERGESWGHRRDDPMRRGLRDREPGGELADRGGGGVQRAATRTTALSQHCPCGARIPKCLAERVHRCPACSLRGDRDAVAAVLASFVGFARPGEPSSAQVDYVAAADALPAIRHALSIPSSGWQDTLPESTGLSAKEGSYLSWRTSTPDPVAVARRTVGMAPCPTLDETGFCQTTPDPARTRTNMPHKYDLLSSLRDNS